MSAERPSDSSLPPIPQHDEAHPESLTDYIDRMDRESFHRSLQQRQLRVLSHELKRDEPT